MWINIGDTYVDTDKIATICKYINLDDYGLIINGVRCPIGVSGYRNLLEGYKQDRIKEINNELDNIVKTLSHQLTAIRQVKDGTICL